MSADLYNKRLFWDGRRGCLKFDGVSVELKGAPDIGVKHMTEVDFAPEVHVAMVRESANAWRDMTPAEISAARLLMDTVARTARTPLGA